MTEATSSRTYRGRARALVQATGESGVIRITPSAAIAGEATLALAGVAAGRDTLTAGS